jgi:hypothetical protein
MGSDETEINALIATFFDGFTSGPGSTQRFALLRSTFAPGAVITKTCGGEPESYDVEQFVGPRETLLTDGTLTDFREWPVDGRLDVFGDIAQWFGSYAKTGVQAGGAFTGAGMKSLQFVRTGAGWRISAVAWDDER